MPRIEYLMITLYVESKSGRILQVFVGSPADGALHRGDVLVAIDNYDASQMLHRQAMDLIKRASNSLIIRLRR